MFFGTSSTSVLALTALGTVINAASCKAQCNANNCLRALRNEDVITAARSFCASYTAVATWTAPLPTYVNACSSSASKISSACSCIAASSTSTTGTPGTSTSSGSTTAATSSPTSSASSSSASSSNSESTSASTSPTSSSSSSSSSSLSSTSSSTSDASSTTECNTALPSTSTVFVTVPASTITMPASTETTTITSNATTTVTTYGYPSSANPGATNLPNPNFEAPLPSPPTDWCRNAESGGGVCTIVQQSDAGYSPRFEGMFGPGMLKMESGEGGFGRHYFSVGDAMTRPNPHGRDWILTAWYRSDAGNPFNCWPIMGIQNLGTGAAWGAQPDLEATDRWVRVTATYPGTAAGAPGPWAVVVTAGCYPPRPGAGLYIDGVTLT